MKRIYQLIIIVIMIFPYYVYATRGCCSHHGGVCGCSKYGVQMCCDGTGSPTCRCTPPQVPGCTDRNANNYNPDANVNDNSCTYTIRGCTDVNAKNYNAGANQDDGSCEYDIPGCTDSNAKNYNYNATVDDGSCEYEDSDSKIYEHTITTPNTETTDEDEELDGIGILTLPVAAIGGYFALKKKKK